MIPRIEILSEKKLIGKHLTMSLMENRTVELWRSFMPRRKEVKKTLTAEMYSMQVYDLSYDFREFNLNAPFEKWAAVEVKDFEFIPEDMESFILPGGLYAVFFFKGPMSEASGFFQYIFGTWLPGSAYRLDHRPHFELLGEKYKNGAPDSEEEVWIPICPKE